MSNATPDPKTETQGTEEAPKETPKEDAPKKDDAPQEEAPKDAPKEAPKEDAPKEEEKPAEEDEDKTDEDWAVDPESLTLPEGVDPEDEATKTQISELAEITGDKSLSAQERTQKLIDLYTRTSQSALDEPYRLWNETQDKWVDEVAKDKDIGTGDTRNPLKPEHRTAIDGVLDAYPDGKKLKDVLNFTGAGNHPDMIRFTLWVANEIKARESRQFVQGEPPKEPKTAAQRMYPDHPSGD